MSVFEYLYIFDILVLYLSNMLCYFICLFLCFTLKQLFHSNNYYFFCYLQIPILHRPTNDRMTL